MAKRVFCVLLVFCMSLALLVNAAALTPHIDSVSKTSGNKYQASGSIEGYSPSGAGQLYVATYDKNGKMTDVKSVMPDSSGNWSYIGGSPSADRDVMKAFVVDGSDAKAPQGPNDAAVIVRTMLQLSDALNNPSCNNIFIADSFALSSAATDKTVYLNKTVTLSKNIVLTVPADCRLQINSGVRLLVGGTLAIAPGATVTVSGSNNYHDGTATTVIPNATLILNGGTVSNEGTVNLAPAWSNTSINYNGGGGGCVTGTGSGGSFVSTGTIFVSYNWTDSKGIYENGGALNVNGFTLDIAAGGMLENGNVMIITQTGTLTGGGVVKNNHRLRLEGGSLAGTLQVNNNYELQRITVYNDNGAGVITAIPAAIGSGVTVTSPGSSWTYYGALVSTEAALTQVLAAVAAGSKLNVEFNSNKDTTVGSFSVPTGVILYTFMPLTLKAGGTINVNGELRVYSPLTVSAGSTLNIRSGGICVAQWGGSQTITNAGTMTVDGALELGQYNGGPGFLVNSSTGVVTVNGLLADLPGSAIQNDGTITGIVTRVSGGALTGSHSAATSSETAEAVSSQAQMSAALIGTSDAVYIVSGFELTSDVAIGKKLIVSRNAWLRVVKGAALALGGNMTVIGYLENWGTINVNALLKLGGEMNNNDNGDGTRGAVNISGTMDLCPGILMRNYGNITLSGGQFRVGGTLCWGQQSTPPTLDVTTGYIKYGSGCIVSTNRTASNQAEYAALMNDATCNNISLNFDMTIGVSTTLSKSVYVPSGRTLRVNAGVTLTVTGNAWLGIGGILSNNGTIIVTGNSGGGQGNVRMNGGSALDTTLGTIEVYGRFLFDDMSSTSVNGFAHITFHYNANLAELARELLPMLSAGYGFTAATAADKAINASAYADWGSMDGSTEEAVAFLLKNMTDRSILPISTGNGQTNLNPWSWLSYGVIQQILGQLWHTVKTADLPAVVSLHGKMAGDLVCIYNYGSGSELDQLCGAFMQALGTVEVEDAVTFTVNSGSSAQSISYKTFKDSVTVNWDRSKGSSVNAISFSGCVFEKGITVVNSGERFWTNLYGCQLPGTVDGKDCNVLVQPEVSGGAPVFDITSGEVFVNLYGTEGVKVGAELSAAHVTSNTPGGTFKINGVIYQGDSSLGINGSFDGRCSVYRYNGGAYYNSYQVGSHTVSVTANGTEIVDFHIWDSVKNNVALNLGTSLTTGGYLDLYDDNPSDTYYIAVTGAVGDDAGGRLTVHLNGSVDISGLQPRNSDIYANDNSAVRLDSAGPWLTPAVTGNYSSATIQVGTGNLTTGYAITLLQYRYNNGAKQLVALTEADGVRVQFNSTANMTEVAGFPNTDGLVLQVSRGGKTVNWDPRQPIFRRRFTAGLRPGAF